MRLSEARITYLAENIARALIAEGAIEFSGSPVVLESEIARVIIDDLKIEEEIDAEVNQMIANMKRNIPQGSFEWQAIYSEKKEEVARRRNYII